MPNGKLPGLLSAGEGLFKGSLPADMKIWLHGAGCKIISATAAMREGASKTYTVPHISYDSNSIEKISRVERRRVGLAAFTTPLHSSQGATTCSASPAAPD